MTKSIRLSLLGAFIIALVGCSSDRRAPVTGKISVAGKGPLPGGAIRFVSVSNPDRVGSGIIHADGTYTVQDAPVGECKVIIDNSHLDRDSRKKTGAGMPMVAPKPGKGGMPPMMKGAGEAPKAAAAKMNAGAPEGAAIPTDMKGKSEIADQQFIRIDSAFAKSDTTSLKAEVKKGSNTIDFQVN